MFIFVQLVLLIAFAHKLNDAVVERWDTAPEESRSRCGWAAVLVVVTFGLYGFAFALAAFMFSEFTDAEGDCALNVAVVAVTLLLCMLVTAASVTPHVRAAQGGSSGLFQSAIMCAYALYLIGSGVLSTPDGHCAPFAGSAAAAGSAKFAGLLCTFLAVLYSTIRNGSTSTASSTPINQGLLADLEAAEASQDEAEDEDETDGKATKSAVTDSTDEAGKPTGYSYAFFHATFSMAAMYICMLLTAWGTLDGVEKELAVTSSMTSVWTKFVTAWICLLLYAWTLVAPILLPDREFSFD